MGKKTPTVACRAWRLLRLPLLWTRKGFDLKPRSLDDDSRLLKLETYPSRCSEREFSFDDTPSNQFKKHHRSVSLCLLPCLAPSVDFEGEDEDELFLRKSREDSDELDPGRRMVEAEEDWDSQSCWSEAMTEKGEGEEEEEIDSRAEKFITEFYQQIKLQPRFSPLAGRHDGKNITCG
ncbi:uncharacterized protein LOC110025855 [Phalaenopsis equestris]|uniref:uncharacterized protein LOC110025855 n=1 Tax=Phalaenopsis equestris TaxID=78828 RepID=UPI0009E26363|nr:uncharacterized protein LOC110025855 [Phalaenopsis equestris]